MFLKFAFLYVQFTMLDQHEYVRIRLINMFDFKCLFKIYVPKGTYC